MPLEVTAMMCVVNILRRMIFFSIFVIYYGDTVVDVMNVGLAILDKHYIYKQLYKLIMNRIQPAERLTNVSEYYFSRKLKEVAQMRAGGQDIISLAIGGPDMPPPQAAVDAAVETLRRNDTHGYQMTSGLPELRAEFARWYSCHYGVDDLNPDTEILPLIGSKEGVLDISLAFLNPGDGVLVPNPGYPTYTSASNIAMAKVYTYDLCEEDGWMPDFDALSALPLDKIKLMWVNYPHMPTGTPATLELFERLVDFGRRHNIVIVNDNPYSMILNDRPLSIFNVPGARDIAIEMNSLSKCLNMAGWRVGVMVASERFVRWVLQVKSNIDSGQPRAIMEGAIAAMRQPRQWYDNLNAVYAERREAATELLELLYCSVRPGQQGLFAWGRLPRWVASSAEASEYLLNTFGIFVTPGCVFGSAGDRYLRVSLCAPVESYKRSVNRIKNHRKQ